MPEGFTVLWRRVDGTTPHDASFFDIRAIFSSLTIDDQEDVHIHLAGVSPPPPSPSPLPPAPPLPAPSSPSSSPSFPSSVTRTHISPGARQQGSGEGGARGGGEEGEGEDREPPLVIKIHNLSGDFPRLRWSYRRLFFPFVQVLHPYFSPSFHPHIAPCKRLIDSSLPPLAFPPTSQGEGLADAKILQGQIRLTFQLKRRRLAPQEEDGEGGKEGGREGAREEPVILLASSQVQLGRLDLRFQDVKGGLGWLYNLLASLFASSVKTYVLSTLLDLLDDHMTALLALLNHAVRCFPLPPTLYPRPFPHLSYLLLLSRSLLFLLSPALSTFSVSLPLIPPSLPPSLPPLVPPGPSSPTFPASILPPSLPTLNKTKPLFLVPPALQPCDSRPKLS